MRGVLTGCFEDFGNQAVVKPEAGLRAQLGERVPKRRNAAFDPRPEKEADDTDHRDAQSLGNPASLSLVGQKEARACLYGEADGFRFPPVEVSSQDTNKGAVDDALDSQPARRQGLAKSV